MFHSKFTLFSFLIFGIFLLSSEVLFSQERDFAFVAASNFTSSNENLQKWYPQGIEIEKSNGAFGYFSPAVFLFRENGDFHEFEISRIGYNNKRAEIYALDSLNLYSRLVGGANVDEFNFALRYTYSFLIDLFGEDSKLKVYLGAGANPYFMRESISPQTSDRFPVSSSTGGIRFSAIPTLTYSISDHWFLNLNMPITVANAYAYKTKTQNPIFSIPDRVLTDSDIKLFPNEWHIRFGLGLRI